MEDNYEAFASGEPCEFWGSKRRTGKSIPELKVLTPRKTSSTFGVPLFTSQLGPCSQR